MEKIILKNNLEFEIKKGGSLETIIAIVQDFASLQPIGIALKEKGNLDLVRFASDGQVTGEYTNMAIQGALFREVDFTDDGKIQAMFSLRQKTELELTIEELQSSQNIQDGAIAELGNVISDITERSEV